MLSDKLVVGNDPDSAINCYWVLVLHRDSSLSDRDVDLARQHGAPVMKRDPRDPRCHLPIEAYH